MLIKRYEVNTWVTREMAGGTWVRYDDVRELQAQNVSLQNRLNLAFRMMDGWVDNAAVVRRIKELVGRTEGKASG